MACFAERLSAALDGSALLLRLARSQCLAADKSCPGRAHTSGGGTQAHSLGGYHRQPEREDHGKWRSMRGWCGEEGEGEKKAQRYRYRWVVGCRASATRPPSRCSRRRAAVVI